MGAKFWLALAGTCIGLAIGAWLLFWLLGTIWYTWGLLAVLILFGGALLLFAWIVDRRDAKARRDLAALGSDQPAA